MNDTIVNMPRVSSSSSEVEKKAPRKRAVRSAPRVASSDSVPEMPRRKAPTTFERTERVATKPRKKLYITISVLLLGFALAAGIGYSDKGQIDITGVITERNAKVSAGESVEGETSATSNTVVPVQNNTSGLLDGGLVGSDTPPPPEPVPEEVASSTEEDIATTTDAEVNEETEEVSDEEVGETEAVAPTEGEVPAN
ncbi:MAG: hypothetical protein R3B53_03570 [Candidatus Paceibacterota bacterium]